MKSQQKNNGLPALDVSPHRSRQLELKDQAGPPGFETWLNGNSRDLPWSGFLPSMPQTRRHVGERLGDFFWRIGGLVTVVKSLQHETKPSNNVGKAIINHPPNHQKYVV